jgi:hypothetical protein
MISADHPPSGTPLRIPPAAWALVIACTALVGLLAHHPGADHATGFTDTLAALVRVSDRTALFHGTLFGVVGALLYGVIALALALGIRRPVIAFGVACHALGCAAVGGAMLFDGFITTRLAQVALDHGWTSDGAGATFALVAIAIQVLTKAGLVGMGAGMCCLSWADLRATRLLAALALPAGLATAIAAVSGLGMHSHSLAILTGLQALWYAGAALTLWRPPGAPGNVNR